MGREDHIPVVDRPGQGLTCIVHGEEVPLNEYLQQMIAENAVDLALRKAKQARRVGLPDKEAQTTAA